MSVKSLVKFGGKKGVVWLTHNCAKTQPDVLLVLLQLVVRKLLQNRLPMLTCPGSV